MDVSREVERLSAHFADAPSIFATSPLYRSLCPVIARDQMALGLLSQRRAGQQPSYLFFGAAHYLLRGAQHPLRAFYPFLTGEAAAAPRTRGPCCSISSAPIRGVDAKWGRGCAARMLVIEHVIRL